MRKTPTAPKIGNGLARLIRIGNSIQFKWNIESTVDQ